eukprot:GHRQ01027547.1.p2 GENE.GHRQ01027547.1~~GHRQ01027547.1.p2  ORF type:complete len:130 (-),score=30.83 GHRQ01027547.1:453-842(-)
MNSVQVTYLVCLQGPLQPFQVSPVGEAATAAAVQQQGGQQLSDSKIRVVVRKRPINKKVRETAPTVLTLLMSRSVADMPLMQLLSGKALVNVALLLVVPFVRSGRKAVDKALLFLCFLTAMTCLLELPT